MDKLWRVLRKLKIELLYDPAIPLLGIYPVKSLIEKEACTCMFRVALSTTGRTCKQLKCPLTGEWIKQMWFTYTMDYYSTIRKNEIILPFAATWMNLGIFILSEVRQRKTNSTGCHSYVESTI